jgi:hypothetical protein
MLTLILAAVLCVEPTPTPLPYIVEGQTRYVDLLLGDDMPFPSSFWFEGVAWGDGHKTCLGQVVRDHGGRYTGPPSLAWCVETFAWFACYDSRGATVYRAVRGDGWVQVKP